MSSGRREGYEAIETWWWFSELAPPRSMGELLPTPMPKLHLRMIKSEPLESGIQAYYMYLMFHKRL